jgi:hypothetical protein
VPRSIAGGLGLAAVIVAAYALSGSSRGEIHGVPAEVGSSPLVVTLHGSVLELLSQPAVDQLSSMESAIARAPGVRRVYGPVAWLRLQIARIARQVDAKTNARVSRAAALVRDSASGGLTIDDGQLTTTLAFGAQVGPLRSLRWLFPSGDAARVFVRLAPGVSRARVGEEVVKLVTSSRLLGITATAQ